MSQGHTQLKWRLARMLNLTGVSPLLVAAENWRHRGSIRAINCHATPAAYRDTFERQLEYFQQHYCDCTLDDLTAFMNTGRWDKPKPGLIITFDDGLASNYRVARYLLEQYGFTGWFFLPTQFLSTPPSEQPEFCEDHIIYVGHELRDPEARERLAMTWDEARTLARKHVIGSHTRWHCRMLPSLPEERLRDEIFSSRRILEEQLGVPIRVYCWVGGEAGTYNPTAARMIREAGYEFAFVTTSAPILPGHDPYQLHRTNVEPNWEIDQVRFQLSGLVDFLHRKKRREVASLTGSRSS